MDFNFLSLLFFSFLFMPLFSCFSDEFENWCKEHGRNYSSESEKLFRFRAFEDNLAFINQHNNIGNSRYTLALNGFADLTHNEFKTIRLGLSPALNLPYPVHPSLSTRSSKGIPSSIDWRKSGAVTPVKDQGACGDCYAFSATGAIEGINKIVTGTLVSLSEQELCDCDKSYNTGCSGGLMDYAFKWVIENHGIDTEEDYPYQASEAACIRNKLKRHVVTIDGYADIPPNNEELLLQAVAGQPVSIGICGSERGFQFYSKGIFTGPCSTSLDHAVLIVGYGSENGVDYWIIKNSWGHKWGMGGYIHMLRNSGNPQGVCGSNMLASYPVKTTPNPPPSPTPEPTKCSVLAYCPSGNTCCCSWKILGVCLSWSCCDMESAVCCNDHHSCCPHDYPTCDTKNQRCLQGSIHRGSINSTAVRALKRRDASHIFKMWNNFAAMGI